MKLLLTTLLLAFVYLIFSWAYSPQEYKDCVNKKGKEACFELTVF